MYDKQDKRVFNWILILTSLNYFVIFARNLPNFSMHYLFSSSDAETELN